MNGRLLAAALLAASGFCALLYQSVWLRELRLVFGASTPSTAATLGLFMGGLGAGVLWLGRRADRSERPLLLYAGLELAVTALAALSPLLLDGARRVYLVAGGSSTFGDVGATLVRLLLAALVIGVPAVCMGGTLPAMARAVTASGDVSRRGLALLYGANTLGAVVGVLWPTFQLFERYGFRATLWLGCLLNAFIGTVAWALSTTESRLQPQDAPAVEVDAPSSARPQRAPVLGAAFASGFAFFLVELVWYRLGAPLLGGSTYTFGVILGCALFGIGAGGVLYSLAPPRRASLGWLGGTFALEAVLLLVPYASGDELALVAFHLRGYGLASFTGLAVGWTLVSAFLVVPTAVVAGYQLPLLVALAGEGADGVGRDVGEVYAANTAGSVSGSLLGGFVLLPFLGAPGSWLLAGGLLVLVALLATASSPSSRRRAAVAVPLALVVVSGVLASAEGPTALWRHTAIGAGRAPLFFASAEERERFEAKLNGFLLEEHEGRESSLAVVGEDGLSVFVNGKSDGSSRGDAATFVGHGLLPALLHPSPKRAFVIGLGTGQTAGWLGRVPTMERVDVVEIEPAMVSFAAMCWQTNQSALTNPKVQLRIADGREALMTSEQVYDVIASEPSNPYRAGVASFYAREFYQAVAGRLSDQGVFAQWVQGYEIDLETLRVVVATLRSVFPYVSVWRGLPSDFLLMATKTPQRLDADVLRARIRDEPFATGLGRVMGIWDLEGLLAAHVANPLMATRLSEGAILNTDDYPALEMRFARSVGRVRAPIEHDVLRAGHWRGLARPDVAGAIDWQRVDALRRRAYDVASEPAPPPLTPARQREDAFWNAYHTVDLRGAREALEDVVVATHDGFALVAAAEVLASVVEERQRFDELVAGVAALGLDGEVAWLMLTRALAFREEPFDRLRLLDDAIRVLRDDPWLPRALVLRGLERLRQSPMSEPELRRAVSLLAASPFAGHTYDYERRLTLAVLLTRLEPVGLPPECLTLFDGYVESNATMLSLQAKCFETHAPERLPAAVAALEQHRAAQPLTLDAILSAPPSERPAP